MEVVVAEYGAAAMTVVVTKGRHIAAAAAADAWTDVQLIVRYPKSSLRHSEKVADLMTVAAMAFAFQTGSHTESVVVGKELPDWAAGRYGQIAKYAATAAVDVGDL